MEWTESLECICVLDQNCFPQTRSIMETMVTAAMAEIFKLVDEGCANLRLENDALKRRLAILESNSCSDELAAEPADSPQSTVPLDGPTDTFQTTAANVNGCEFVVSSPFTLWRDPDAVSTPDRDDKMDQSVSPSTVADVSIMKTGESLKLERCTTCCSLYHCPLCRPSVFKPTEYHRVVPHTQSHQMRAIKHKGLLICKCNLECRKNSHYHCCYCSRTISSKSHFMTHVRVHCETASVPSALQILRPTATLVFRSAVAYAQNPHTPPGQTADSPSDSAPDSPPTRDAPESVTPEYDKGPPDQNPDTPSPPSPAAPVSQNLDAGATRSAPDVPPGQKRAATLAEKPARRPPTPKPRKASPRFVQCQYCGSILLQKNFRVHLVRRHPEASEDTRSRQQRLRDYVTQQGLLQLAPLPPSLRRKKKKKKGVDGEEEGLWDSDVGERSKGFADTCELLTFEPAATTQEISGEMAGAATKYSRVLGRPHLLELPLELLAWIFKEVLDSDGKMAVKNLSLVCKDFRSILESEAFTRQLRT